MYQSKVSNFTNSKFPSFGISQISHYISPANTSTAHGFLTAQCPSHPQYMITNICLSPSCIEPLCPQCIPNHIKLHEQTKQPSKIQTIFTARINCIQKLAEQKYYVQTDLQKINQEYSNDPQTIVVDLKTKLTNSKTKLIKLIDKLYDQMNQQIELIYSAYVTESDKNIMEVKKVVNPLVQYLQFITDQKQQLESDDFISPLIQILTEFPQRPPINQLKKPTNYGSIQVNTKVLQDIHRCIQKYTHVNMNFKQDINKLTTTNMNIKSNNSKFSRINAEKSRIDRSRSRQRSIFQSKVIPPNNSSTLSCYIQQNEYKVIYNELRLNQIQINQNNYFQNIGTLTYFEQNTRTIHAANIDYLQEGFSRKQLMINFLIPEKHRSIVLPSNQTLMFGGKVNQIATNKSFTLNGNSLIEIASMNTERYGFGICYNEGYVYVLGGCQAQDIYTNKFERYNLNKKCWSVLKPFSQPTYDCQLVSFNHFIVKIGGKSPSSTNNSINLYNIETDNWTTVPINPRYILPSNSGLAQISHNQILLFGGYIKQSKTNEVFVIRFNGFDIQFQKCVQIYSQSTFCNPIYVHKRALLALQNTSKGTGKNILSFNGSNWRFVSC